MDGAFVCQAPARPQRTRLGELIAAHRDRRGWSQTELGVKIALLSSKPGRDSRAGEHPNGRHENSVGNWEQLLGPDDLPTVPHRSSILLAAEALGLRTGRLHSTSCCRRGTKRERCAGNGRSDCAELARCSWPRGASRSSIR